MNKIAVLFPGQGAQYIGMGKTICRDFKAADYMFNEANEILGFDIKALCFEGDLDELTKTENAQPALLTASVAAFKVLRKISEVTPFYLAGHSLGEFSALVCSKAISFSDALKLVRKRGELMAKASQGGMAAVMGAGEAEIRAVCEQVSTRDCFAVVSNNNSPDQIVISGHKQAIAKAGEVLSNMGVKVKALNVSAAFHSPLMTDAADEFKELLENTVFRIPSWPVISNVTAKPITASSTLAEELYRQLISPVQWQKTMSFMQNHNVNTFIDIGPGQVVKNLASKNIPDAQAYAFDKPKELESIINEYPVNPFKPKISFLPKAMAIAVCTKNNNWDNSEYEAGVIKPYNEVQSINSRLEETGAEATEEQMKIAVDMLSSVFTCKRTPIDEQAERFTQLFDDTDTWGAVPGFKLPV
ncbi:[acyl-carrier-protein] S-malonyltransferase [Anaerobacterium chartisolvens]|uniref:[acyl-carrier-protein] S-malonyltransferase n=1 Tax=Anaerobacterium chartisolvens TaxID=1297424 RepID=A0A369B418_9FIRM|nr:ACP S-malonyltransferase [Anaerobacterium chartisolvens]RCX16300.1 [acyl-carrier-protein] S-malonyltransferase [Anaerobacterium chartisolvens]